MKILKITDNLSRTLQTRSMSASEGQSVAELSVKTLQLMRNDESFDAFFRLVNCFREQTGTSSPKLPRKRQVPSRFEVGEGKESYNDSSIEDHYRRLYFEVLDLAVTGISQRFNQPGYSIYKNLENLLVYAANRKPFDEQLCAVLSHYGDDLASCQLSAQLQIWGAYFAEAEALRSLTAFVAGMTSSRRTRVHTCVMLIRIPRDKVQTCCTISRTPMFAVLGKADKRIDRKSPIWV